MSSKSSKSFRGLSNLPSRMKANDAAITQSLLFDFVKGILKNFYFEAFSLILTSKKQGDRNEHFIFDTRPLYQLKYPEITIETLKKQILQDVSASLKRAPQTAFAKENTYILSIRFERDWGSHKNLRIYDSDVDAYDRGGETVFIYHPRFMKDVRYLIESLGFETTDCGSDPSYAECIFQRNGNGKND